MHIGIDLVIMAIAVAIVTVGTYIICSKIKGYDEDASNKLTFAAFIAAMVMFAVYVIMSMVLDYYLGIFW